MLAQAGQAANESAARHRFADYRMRRAEQTVRRQQADLALFAGFLDSLGVHPGALAEDPEAWRGITWGLVEAFVKWQLQQGSERVLDRHDECALVHAAVRRPRARPGRAPPPSRHRRIGCRAPYVNDRHTHSTGPKL